MTCIHLYYKVHTCIVEQRYTILTFQTLSSKIFSKAHAGIFIAGTCILPKKADLVIIYENSSKYIDKHLVLDCNLCCYVVVFSIKRKYHIFFILSFKLFSIKHVINLPNWFQHSIKHVINLPNWFQNSIKHVINLLNWIQHSIKHVINLPNWFQHSIKTCD